MNDLQLWQAMKKGDRSALEKIYAQHIQLLLQYGKKWSTDESLIEDCLHDLFVELWNKRERLGDTDSIIKYLVVSFKRKIFRAKKQLAKTTYTDEVIPEGKSEEFMWPQEDTNNPALTKLSEALKDLTPNQREAIYLKYYAGMEYEEICEILDMKYQSVRNLIHRALTKLRGLMSWLLWVLSFALSTKQLPLPY